MSGMIPGLDGLRAIAFLLVFAFHTDYLQIGWVGVSLFFVLSGFLITRQLLDSQGSSNYYRAFFGRRTLRIFPLYYSALLIGFVVVPLLFPNTAYGAASHPDQIWLWVFLVNWAQPFGADAYPFSHFWSLAIEEQFYLIWPFVVRRLDPRALLVLSAWLALAALMIRIVMRASAASPDMLYAFTICRMDALVIGAIVAALVRIPALDARALVFAPWLIPVASLLGLTGALITRAYTRDTASTQTVGYSIFAVFSGLILLASIIERGGWNRRLQAMLSAAPLRSVGKYSYGMYVIHYPIILGLQKVVPRFQEVFGNFYIIPLLLVILLLSYAAAFLSYHAMEKHFLRLKRWFVPTRVSGPDFETLQGARGDRG